MLAEIVFDNPTEFLIFRITAAIICLAAAAFCFFLLKIANRDRKPASKIILAAAFAFFSVGIVSLVFLLDPYLKHSLWFTSSLGLSTLTLLYLLYQVVSQYQEVRKLKSPQELEEIIANQTQKHKDSIKQLEALSAELSYQNKQLYDFANITSHNLRSPSGNIKALIELIEMDRPQEEKEMLFEKLKQSSERLQSTLNDLTEIVKVKKGYSKRKEKLFFQDVTENISNSLHADLIRHEGQIETSFERAPEIYYPKVYLESILLNLISNALKYRHPERPPVIKITSEPVGSQIKLKCKDNGLGIDLEKHGKNLFRLHQTFHGNKDARGVGLFITKNQIETMGGSISVESEPGKGTTFHLLLPAQVQN